MSNLAFKVTCALKTVILVEVGHETLKKTHCFAFIL